jgi:hypothetical protein
MADLSDRHNVQRPIELAVAATVEPVTAHITAGRLDRRGAVVTGVTACVGETSGSPLCAMIIACGDMPDAE